jgi:acetyl esterase/lipase
MSTIRRAASLCHQPIWRAVAIGMIVIGIAGCSGALFSGLNSVSGRKGVVVKTNIVFDAQKQLAADVYEPAQSLVKAGNLPLVVFFYGGSWVKGRRQWYRYLGEALAASGVVAVIPDYRKYPEASPEGFMSDAAEAVGWARDHAASFGADPRALFVMGHSAGAQIGALLATDARWLAAVGMKPRDLAGFIGLSGAYNFEPFNDPEIVRVFGRDPASQRAMEPLNFVSGDEPPMLLIHGTRDTEVRPSDTLLLAAMLKQHHESVDLHLYKGVSHGMVVLAFAPSFQRRAPVLRDTLAFIRAHDPAVTAFQCLFTFISMARTLPQSRPISGQSRAAARL